MAAHVRVRAAYVSHDEVVVTEMLGQPGRVDAPPSQCGDDTGFRRDRRPLLEPREPVGEGGESVVLDAEHVARTQEPWDKGDVREPVLRTAEVRLLAEPRVEPARARASNASAAPSSPRRRA